MNLNELASLRGVGLEETSGPKANLILPNPIDATSNPFASVSDSLVLQSGGTSSLIGLSLPSRLENSFLKVRIHEVGDALSLLATPNSGPNYFYQPGDVHYSEAMAYRSVSNIQAYVEALGFSIVKSRPLYVMVQAAGSNSQDINAYYDHGYLNPAQPRTISLYGTSQYAPGMDQDIYWHEFGHMLNESITSERGIDFAGDKGAVWTEGSALHECLADYLAESVSGRGYVGKWVARNFAGYEAGQPLRSAEDTSPIKLDFKRVISADGTGEKPERYAVAEWCSRVLWEIRDSFVRENSQTGPIYSDRMIYSAASLLGRDSSISEFQTALMQADDELHCGGHQDFIAGAFESRGFTKPGTLGQPLTVTAQPASAAPGRAATFVVVIQNPNGEVARNVRVQLESMDPRLIVTTYMQAYGDLPPGATLNIGGPGGLSSAFSVAAEFDSGTFRGQQLPYRIRVLSENGVDAVIDGVIRL